MPLAKIWWWKGSILPPCRCSFFAIGDVVLEMTQIGKECHSDCAIRQQTGDCIMPREGVFARVVEGGTIHTGYEMKLLPTPADLPLRAAVITLSDKGSRGEREDKSGPLIVEMLTATGYKVEAVSYTHLGLAHIVDGEQRGRNAGQSFHFHAGHADGPGRCV